MKTYQEAYDLAKSFGRTDKQAAYEAANREAMEKAMNAPYKAPVRTSLEIAQDNLAFHKAAQKGKNGKKLSKLMGWN